MESILNSIPCDICLRVCGNDYQTVPDRSDTNYQPHNLCVNCLDSFLIMFPITPDTFLNRELTGRFSRKREKVRRKYVWMRRQ
jgi:hypothetical protein